MNKPTSLTYKDAGVDIDAGNQLIQRIKPAVKKTYRDGVLGDLGGFGGLFAIPKGYQEPILVSATDGVGTKLKFAIDYQEYDTIGIDLVAMCVNDLIVQGAEPLFFLDYFACGKLDVNAATQVINGIADGCLQANCALIGGETAEMPGMYQNKDFDLAGFSVGVVEKSNIIDGSLIKPDDCLIALASSGPHANGYSLIRKIIAQSGINPWQPLKDQPLLKHLLCPTRIYVNALNQLKQTVELRGVIHITGGGFWENIPRVLPENVKAVIDSGSWQWPAIFHWLKQQGNISTQEMYRTFNCGVGMIIVVPQTQAHQAINLLTQAGETAWVIGKIQSRLSHLTQVEIN